VLGMVLATTLVRRLFLFDISEARPIKHPNRSYWLNTVMEQLLWLVLNPLAGGTEWMNITMRLFGAKVSEGVYLDFTYVQDAPMLLFGRGSSVHLAIVEAHSPPLDMWKQEFGHVRLGAWSSVERNCLLSNPAEVADYVALRPLTRGLVGEKYPSETEWAGSPAEQVGIE